jgi:prepilin peptidase dependent protein B
MHLSASHNQRGFTLIELMVANTLGLILILVLLTMAIHIINTSRLLINNNRVTADLQSTLNLISNDVHRAGYWGTTVQAINANTQNNPFAASPITINSSCLLFMYDRDANGSAADSNNALLNEHFGYRLNTTTHVIEALTTDNASNFNCTAISTDWVAITDPNVITVTAFNIIDNAVVIPMVIDTHSLTRSSMVLTLTGNLTGSTTSTTSLTQTVFIQNDFFT